MADPRATLDTSTETDPSKPGKKPSPVPSPTSATSPSSATSHDTNTIHGALRYSKELKTEQGASQIIKDIVDGLVTRVEQSAGEQKTDVDDQDKAQRVPTAIRDPNQFLADIHVQLFTRLSLDVKSEIKSFNSKTIPQEKAEVLLDVVNKLCMRIDSNIKKIAGLQDGKEPEIKKQETLLNLALRVYKKACELHNIQDEKYHLSPKFCPLMHMLHASTAAVETIVTKDEFKDLYYQNYEEFYHLLAQKCIAINLSRVPSHNANLIHQSAFVDVHGQLEQKEFESPQDNKHLGRIVREFIDTERTFLTSFRGIFSIQGGRTTSQIDDFLKGVADSEKAKLAPYLALYKKFISDHPLNQLDPDTASLSQLLKAFTANETIAHMVWLAHAMMMQRIIQDQGLFDHLSKNAQTALNAVAIMPPQRNPRYKLLLLELKKHAGAPYSSMLASLISAVHEVVDSANTGMRNIEACVKVIKAGKPVSEDKFKKLIEWFDVEARKKLELGDAQQPGRIITLLEHAKIIERARQMEAKQAALQEQIDKKTAELKQATDKLEAAERTIVARDDTIQSQSQEIESLRREATNAKASEAKAQDDAAQLIKANKEETDKHASGIAGAVVNTLWGPRRNLSVYQEMSNRVESTQRELEALKKAKGLEEKELESLRAQIEIFSKELPALRQENQTLKATFTDKDQQVLKAWEMAQEEQKAAAELKATNDELQRQLQVLKDAQSTAKPSPQTAASGGWSLSTLFSPSAPAPAGAPAPKIVDEEKEKQQAVQQQFEAIRQEFQGRLESQRKQLEEKDAALQTKEDELKAAEDQRQHRDAEFKHQQDQLAQSQQAVATQTTALTEAQVVSDRLSRQNGILLNEVAELTPKSWKPWVGGSVFGVGAGIFSGTASTMGFVGVGTFAALGIGPPGWAVIAVLLIAVGAYCIHKAVNNYFAQKAYQALHGTETAARTASPPPTSGTGLGTGGLTNNATMNLGLKSTFVAPPSSSPTAILVPVSDTPGSDRKDEPASSATSSSQPQLIVVDVLPPPSSSFSPTPSSP